MCFCSQVDGGLHEDLVGAVGKQAAVVAAGKGWATQQDGGKRWLGEHDHECNDRTRLQNTLPSIIVDHYHRGEQLWMD